MLQTPPQSVRDTHRNGLLLGLHDRYIPPFSSGFLTSQAISRRRQLAKGICRPVPAGALLRALLGPAGFLVGGSAAAPVRLALPEILFQAKSSSGVAGS